ncbi:MAG: lipoate protein ligase C-terminal domain-containing protein, partial [Candidatus Cloacimonetes bacterium]|nr:lipoate protein ligase C-terminal domain-containing protein [Candidatus Cloacimonadota bacterium]
TIELYLDVSNGIITSLRIFGDFFSPMEMKDLEQAFSGVAHDAECVRQTLLDADYQAYLGDVELDELVSAMF